MAAGVLLLMAGGSVWVTIGGTLVMGYLGTLLVVMIQATLADHHGVRHATALTESNILAMLCAGLSPLMIGLFERMPLGWRGALLLGLLAGALIGLRYYRGTPLPPRHVVGVTAQRQRLPAAFWALWVVLILSVAMEWSR